MEYTIRPSSKSSALPPFFFYHFLFFFFFFGSLLSLFSSFFFFLVLSSHPLSLLFGSPPWPRLPPCVPADLRLLGRVQTVSNLLLPASAAAAPSFFFFFFSSSSFFFSFLVLSSHPFFFCPAPQEFSPFSFFHSLPFYLFASFLFLLGSFLFVIISTPLLKTRFLVPYKKIATSMF